MTGVSECSQQRGNLKDDGYNSTRFKLLASLIVLMRVKSFAD
ncbi:MULTISPECIES: hypothetical protein [Photorhabdus]|nr:hypothetical protein [Photorhabdus asymbiotica]